jgi:serine/threonine-protein phosphatase 6 regulatory ankyrin repeat subunit B
MRIQHVIARALALVAACALLCGCQQYSKEQQREIDEIKQRVLNRPGLIDRDEGHGTPLETATLNGYVDLAEWLVDHHANVNALDHEEGTVLHRAVIDDQSPNLKMLRFLLRKGAHVDARRKGIETPLHLAVFLGRADVVNMLLAHGADVHARGNFGQTPMHLASFPQGYPEIITILLAHGASLNERQNNRATPLHLAAMGHNTEVMTLLVNKGADIRLADAHGATALHYAAQSGNGSAASVLLDHGTDANALDFENHTPLWLALHRPAITAGPGYSGKVDTSDVAELLRAHGGRE